MNKNIIILPSFVQYNGEMYIVYTLYNACIHAIMTKLNNIKII